MRKHPVLLAAFLVTLPSALTAATNYSDELLATPAIMSRAEWVVDLTRFNNWLNENHDKLGPDRIAGPREHLYLVVDSILRDRHSEGRSDFSEIELMGLKEMFTWGTRLGLIGCGLVASHLAGGAKGKMEEALLPPEPFELRLEFPLYTLSSASGGWEVEFPYYFMIGDVKRFTSSAGLDTEIAIVSTLFAKHESGEGQSQSTIMFIFSPTEEEAEFRTYWLNLLDLSNVKKRKKSPVTGSANYYGFNRDDKMHKEATFIQTTTGTMLVSFMGLDGTYQANRPHYVSFLQSLKY